MDFEMTARPRALELKAFSAKLGRTDRVGANELWSAFAEAKMLLASVHATWALALSGVECDVTETLQISRRRALALAERVDTVRLGKDRARAAFAAALRDFARATSRGEAGDVLIQSAVAYGAGRELALELWAFELAPEGAPLRREVASQYIT
jgi:hypothetical protein